MNPNYRHAEVLYYEDKMECDMCDSRDNTSVVIGSLDTDCICVCLDCLQKIINEGRVDERTI